MFVGETRCLWVPSAEDRAETNRRHFEADWCLLLAGVPLRILLFFPRLFPVLVPVW